MKNLMRKYLLEIGFAFATLSALAFNLVVGQMPGQDDAALATKIDELFGQWDKPDSPGCALGVITDGQFIYENGYRMANLDHDIPITPDTTFYLRQGTSETPAQKIN